MSVITDKLPTSIIIGGTEYEINTDFRVMIKFENLIFDSTVSDEEKVIRSLLGFYKIMPDNAIEAANKLLWFYRCGKEEAKGGNHKRIYDYEYDADYIYAAFLNQYDIDINSIDYLHWWKFKALFSGLTDANTFVKIMQYRAADVSNMDKAEKKFYLKMKKQYEIPKSKAEKEKANAIENALLNGGDLSNL